MKSLMPAFFLLAALIAFFLNLFGLMNLMPVFITLPLLFISIYLFLYSFANRHVYRGWHR